LDVREYIESGIIEAVVLGFANEQEIAQLQSYASKHPEILAEWKAVTNAFELEATKHAVPAPTEVKQRIIDVISADLKKETPIVTLPTTPTASNPWKWLAAASIVLAIGATSLWYANYSKLQEMNSSLAAKDAEIEKMDQRVTALSVEQEKTAEMKKVLAQLDTKKIEMKGTAMEPAANVQLMWNENNKMAMMKSVAIEEIPYEMQFQLWAIADGKPVSLGVFDPAELENMTDPFAVDAKNISAFAITIEKRGGSQSPTMEKMVVMGAISV